MNSFITQDSGTYDSLCSTTAGKDILRSFHHQELCHLKICVLCSSQKECIVSPAIVLRSSSTYLEFLKKLEISVSPQLSWNCGIAFHSCQSQDNLGLSLGGGHLTLTTQIDSTELKKVAFANFFLNYWNGFEWAESFLPKSFLPVIQV